MSTKMDALDFFDTLPDYALDNLKNLSLRQGLECVEGAIEELETIAYALRSDIEREEADESEAA